MSWCSILPKRASASTFCRKKIMKNIWLLAWTWFFLFAAFGGLGALQSSLHREEGMGTTTQAILYAAMIFSCLFLTRLVILQLGHKWTIAVSIMGYMLWMAANAYAVWGTMVTASIIVGLVGSPMWTAQCAYYTEIAPLYAQQSGEPVNAVLSRFFGIFFLVFQSNSILGSVISSTVLRPIPVNGTEISPPSDETIATCGVNDCPWNNVTNPNLERPPEYLVWTLVVIYLCIALVGLTSLLLFLDPLPTDIEKVVESMKNESTQNKNCQDRGYQNDNFDKDTLERNDETLPEGASQSSLTPSFCAVGGCKEDELDKKIDSTPDNGFVLTSSKEGLEEYSNSSGKADKATTMKEACEEIGLMLAATVAQWKKKEQLLMIVITMFSGLEQTFIGGDFTKSYITCVLGIWMVGFVKIPQSATDAASSYAWGALVKFTGRIPIMIFAACLKLGLIFTLLFWTVHTDTSAVIFIIAVLWGCCNAAWQTQINAFYGILFADQPEAAFANYRIWESLGFIIAWGYSARLCTDVKLYVLLAFVTVGMAGYGMTEVLHRRKANKNDTVLTTKL